LPSNKIWPFWIKFNMDWI